MIFAPVRQVSSTILSGKFNDIGATTYYSYERKVKVPRNKKTRMKYIYILVTKSPHMRLKSGSYWTHLCVVNSRRERSANPSLQGLKNLICSVEEKEKTQINSLLNDVWQVKFLRIFKKNSFKYIPPFISKLFFIIYFKGRTRRGWKVAAVTHCSPKKTFTCSSFFF